MCSQYICVQVSLRTRFCVAHCNYYVFVALQDIPFQNRPIRICFTPLMSDLKKKKNYVKLFVKKTMVYAILMKVVYASVSNRKNRLFSDSDCNKTALVKMH